MRTWLLLAALLLAPTVSAAGEEDLSRLILLDRLYSVVAPTDWHYDIDEETGTVAFTNREGSLDHLLVTVPNPNVKGELKKCVAAYLDLFKSVYKTDAEVLITEGGDFGGYPSLTVGFAAPNREEAMYMGIASAVDIKGFGVTFFAVSTADDYDAFMDTASGVIDSYTVNEGIMRARARQLAALGDILDERLAASVGGPVKEKATGSDTK